MADMGICNPSGCYGRCPTSTICSRKPCCPPVDFGEGDGCVQPMVCDCGYGSLCPPQCPPVVRTKSFIAELLEELHYFKHYYDMIRDNPPIKNKTSKKRSKGSGGKMRGSKKGRGGDGNQSGGLFNKNDEDDYDEDGDEDGGGRGGQRNKPSKEARLRNKLNALFDEALKNGMLLQPEKDKRKRTPEYYKDVLGISVSCLQTCEPECCFE